jgi:metal-responsive CopG/Arc/MetJ family transcriptional regulator
MVRINTVFQEDILEEIDRIAKEKGKSRSRLLRDAAQNYIKQYQIQKAEEMKRKKIKTSMEVQDRIREKSGKWDSVSELRKWRDRRS